MPKRIQRKRTKGWRMPEGAVYVGRPTKWGNPFEVYRCKCCDAWDVRDENGVVYLLDHKYLQEHPDVALTCSTSRARTEALAQAVSLYYMDLNWELAPYPHASELRGKDLACWCPLDQPCHADVLLELANREARDE